MGAEVVQYEVPAERANCDRHHTLALGTSLVEEAKSLVIDCHEMRQYAADFIARVKGQIKALTEERLAKTRPLDEAKASWINFFKPHIESREEAERIVKGLIKAYDDELEKKRAEEQRRLEEEAAKERARIAAELRANAEAAARAAIAGDAKAVESAAAKAEELQARSDVAQVVVLPPAVEKVDGLSSRSNWKARSIDLKALVKAASINDALLVYLLPNEKAINQVAKTHKSQTCIPGVEVFNDKVLSSRSA